MTAIANGIRDALLPEAEIRERKEAHLKLEVSKLALRVTAAVLAFLSFCHPLSAVLLLPTAWASVELSNIARSGQDILEDFTTEVIVSLSEKALAEKLLENAPLLRLIYRFETLDER